MVHEHVFPNVLRGLSVEREGKSAAYKARLEQNRDPGKAADEDTWQGASLT